MSSVDKDIAETLSEEQAQEVLAIHARTEAIRKLLERNAVPGAKSTHLRSIAQEAILTCLDEVDSWAISAIGAQ